MNTILDCFVQAVQQQAAWIAYPYNSSFAGRLSRIWPLDETTWKSLERFWLSWKFACVLTARPVLQRVSNPAALSRQTGQQWSLQHLQDAELDYTGVTWAATLIDTFSYCVEFRGPYITSQSEVCLWTFARVRTAGSVPTWKCSVQGLEQPEPLTVTCCICKAELWETSIIIYSWNNF